MISSKAASSSSSLCSRSMVLLVARTITCGLPSTATTHRRIASCSPAALSSYSYSTSSYSSGVGGNVDDVDDDDDDDDVDDLGEEYNDYEDDDDEEKEEDDIIYEMNMPTSTKRASWTDDLVR